jgi:Cytochrome b5-like Heme/Steroid binding domain
MMGLTSRRFFIASTALFWLGVAVLALSGRGVAPLTAPPPAAPAARSLPAAPSATSAPSGHFTLAEVGRHRTAGDCWLVIDGGVYDVTAYLPEHPSRPEVVTAWCGREATEAYQTKTRGRAHSREADALLQTQRIGQLTPPLSQPSPR